MTMINDDKDDDLDIYYPHSDAPKPAWPSADRGGNRFSASSLRLPWVNPLQTLQTLPFPPPRFGSTPFKLYNPPSSPPNPSPDSGQPLFPTPSELCSEV